MDVDVAIVMESTYPYLKGGVSAVVHDIITGNPDLTFGIIHITWDSHSPLKDLYGMPDNVAWVKVLYLSMEEHQEDFLRARPRDLRMNRRQRRELSRRILGALLALAQDGQTEPLWDLISEGLSASRRYPVWAILGTREFMEAYHDMMPDLGMSMTDIFWCLRDFFSLAYAVLAEPVPRAQVYHAHTTGYAMLLGVNAAREHGTKVLLTEHNLYVRDTVNTLLERRLDLNIRLTDYRTFDVTGRERMWMAWWLEMGRLCYPYAYASTYLYPRAITEANELGGDSGRAIVIPNGIVTSEFDASYAARLAAIEEIKKEGADKHLWKLVYIARVVPIKGLLDMIDSVRLMVDRGLNIHLDVCGPTEHMPSYFEQCLTRIVEQGLESVITIRGTVKVRELLPEFDLFVLPSYNEGLPVVSLETMGAGIPTVSTDVGAVRSVVEDMIVTDDGQTWDPCGIIIEPGDPTVMADKVQEVISDVDLYERLSLNARGRVEAAYDLVKVNASYNKIYRQGGAGEQTGARADQGGA
ncbi:glycosyl transferase family 1 [Actinomyces oris]|nr:glycosyl transferase family 1 [Actinomyces oris]